MELQASNGSKVQIEKDVTVLISILNIHYDPEYYENPEKFMPERFDDGKLKEYKNKGVYLAFGGGPRVCLGRKRRFTILSECFWFWIISGKIAALQSKALIAEAVKDFEISVDPKTEEPLVLDPKEFLNVKRGGLWLNFKEI